MCLTQTDLQVMVIAALLPSVYCFKLQFMTKISSDTWKQHLIRKFDNSFRHLTDTLALNNDDISMYNKEIYPDELT